MLVPDRWRSGSSTSSLNSSSTLPYRALAVGSAWGVTSCHCAGWCLPGRRVPGEGTAFVPRKNHKQTTSEAVGSVGCEEGDSSTVDACSQERGRRSRLETSCLAAPAVTDRWRRRHRRRCSGLRARRTEPKTSGPSALFAQVTSTETQSVRFQRRRVRTQAGLTVVRQLTNSETQSVRFSSLVSRQGGVG